MGFLSPSLPPKKDSPNQGRKVVNKTIMMIIDADAHGRNFKNWICFIVVHD